MYANVQREMKDAKGPKITSTGRKYSIVSAKNEESRKVCCLFGFAIPSLHN